MVMFTCDKGEGGAGAVPGQLCSPTPTHGDTESFSAAGQETQCFSLPPAWDHVLRAELGQFLSLVWEDPTRELSLAQSLRESRKDADECHRVPRDGSLGVPSLLPWHNSYSSSSLSSSNCISSFCLSTFLILSQR